LTAETVGGTDHKSTKINAFFTVIKEYIRIDFDKIDKQSKKNIFACKIFAIGKGLTFIQRNTIFGTIR
jgi:hypothetical protein